MHSVLQSRGCIPVDCGAFRCCDHLATRVGACSLSWRNFSSNSASRWRFARRPFNSSGIFCQLRGLITLGDDAGRMMLSSRTRSERLVANSKSRSVVAEAEKMLDGDHSEFFAESSDTKSQFTVTPAERPVTSKVEPVGPGYGQTKLGRPTTGALQVDGFFIERVSVGGQETCVKVAFDSGRFPEQLMDMDFLFLTHAHMDHIRGLTIYIASRTLKKKKLPTVIVPRCVKATVEKLRAVQIRELDKSPLPFNLIGMGIGEEFHLGKGLIVKAFKTYHVVPSQGYVIYSVKQKLKAEYAGLAGKEMRALRESGAEVHESSGVDHFHAQCLISSPRSPTLFALITGE